MSYRLLIIFGCMAAVIHCLPSAADDWPQFRGPNCSGVASGTEPLPVRLGENENLAWSAPAGDGIGGAVVADGRLFVSGMTSAETVTLFAFDPVTGNELWQRSWPTGPLPQIHEVNSHASSTPAADAEQVYFYFSTLGLVALDAHTGNNVWKKKLPVPFFVFKWGAGMSPVLCEDMVVFCQDDDLHPAIYAFDAATGDLRWKDDRVDMSVNYTHPVVCRTPDRTDIVVGGTGMLIGYDPQSGKRRWHAKVLLRNIKTTPLSRDGVMYVSLQSSGIANQWIVSVDRNEDAGNNDGRLEREEIAKFLGKQEVPAEFFERTFGRGDTNGDGYLEGAELDTAFLHPDNFAGADYRRSGAAAAEQYIMAVEAGGEGDVTETHVRWKHATKHTDHIVSPLLLEDRLFLLESGGITTVFGTQDGEPLRGPARVGRGGNYFSSPVTGDSKVYVCSANGDIVVLDADSLQPLARNTVGESIVATPAIADGRMFVRTRTRLLCFAERP